MNMNNQQIVLIRNQQPHTQINSYGNTYKNNNNNIQPKSNTHSFDNENPDSVKKPKEKKGKKAEKKKQRQKEARSGRRKKHKTERLYKYISPAPCYYKVISKSDDGGYETNEEMKGRFRIQLKLLKNPVREALFRLGTTESFTLDEMLDTLVEVEDNDDIKRTNSAKKRLKEGLNLPEPGIFNVENSRPFCGT